MLLGLTLVWPAASAAEPVPGASGTVPAEASALAEAGAAAEEEDHGGGLVDLVARLFNFAILAGTLFFVLRSPLGMYVRDRHAQVRKELVEAAALRESASADLKRIEARLAALPQEVAALRARGADEIAAEEARITQAAEAERARLLEETRREIDFRLRVARRELVRHAAELAVDVAADRVKQRITREDQVRLVERYVDQLKTSR
jgi:F-type H+-transporting ATPase subunit b